MFNYPMTITLLVLAIVSFIQNMAFTFSSRSRNSGDPDYHRLAALLSNSIWFFCNVLIIKTVWTAISAGDWRFVAIAGIVYTLATAEGSVVMMKIMLKREKGSRKVGA